MIPFSAIAGTDKDGNSWDCKVVFTLLGVVNKPHYNQLLQFTSNNKQVSCLYTLRHDNGMIRSVSPVSINTEMLSFKNSDGAPLMEPLECTVSF